MVSFVLIILAPKNQLSNSDPKELKYEKCDNQRDRFAAIGLNCILNPIAVSKCVHTVHRELVT